MLSDYSYNYAIVMYDIADLESEVGKNRVAKVFKICKKYFHHHQKSIFKGNITPSKLIKFKSELNAVIDKKLDFVTIIKLQNKHVFEEEILGTPPKPTETLFL